MDQRNFWLVYQAWSGVRYNLFGNCNYYNVERLLNQQSTGTNTSQNMLYLPSHGSWSFAGNPYQMSNGGLNYSVPKTADDSCKITKRTLDDETGTAPALVRHPVTRIKRRRKARVGGTSKYRGVSYHSRDKRFMARLWNSYTGKTEHLGSFVNELDAAKAVDDRVLELYGNGDPDVFLNLK